MLLKKETGAALPIALIVVFVLSILGFTLIAFAMNETRQVAMDENRMRAHYIARSGAHAVAAHLYINPKDAKDLINSSETPPVEFGGGEFKVLVYGDPTQDIHIKSTAEVNDRVQTVVLTVKNVGIDFALYGSSVLVNSNSAVIADGDLIYGYYLNIDDRIVKDGEIHNIERDFDPVILPCDIEDVNSDLYIFSDRCSSLVLDVYENEVINDDAYYDEIRLQGGGSNLVINAKSADEDNADNDKVDKDLLIKIDQIRLGGGADFIIDLGDNSKNIVALVVEDLYIGANSKIVLKGSGFLVIYVTEKFESNGKFEPELDSDVSVNIYVDEGGYLSLGGTQNITGSIYAPSATVDVSGNIVINGWVLSDEFKGGGNMHVYYRLIEMADSGISFDFYRIDKWRYDE